MARGRGGQAAAAVAGLNRPCLYSYRNATIGSTRVARRAGALLARARAATRELTDSLDAEFEGETAPLKDLQNEYRATKDQLSDSASKLTDLTAIDGGRDDDAGSAPDTDDSGSDDETASGGSP